MKKILFGLLFLIMYQCGYGQTPISSGILKGSVDGSEKIPVSGAGHPVINGNLLHTYHKARFDSVYVKITAPKFIVGSDATGDIYYRNSGGVLIRLGIGSSGNVLTVTGGVPTWVAPTGSVTSVFSRTGAVVATSGDYTEAQISFSDITTNNVSITKHGYVPKAPNDATKYFDGTGVYSVPYQAGIAGQFLTSNGSSSTPTFQDLTSINITSALGYIPINPANNGSDFSSAGTTRQNLGIAGSELTFNTQAGNYTLLLSDAPPNNSGKFVVIKSTGSSPATITIPNDATTNFAIGTTIYGRNQGTSTVTFTASSPASILSTSGALLAPSIPFLWALTKDAANHWVLDNSGLGLGSANQMLGVDNGGTGQEYKTVSNGLTVGTGTFKLGGALTQDTNLSGAFSLGLGVAPTAKFHMVGLGTTTGNLLTVADNTPTTRLAMFDNGKSTFTAASSGDALTDYQWNPTWTLTANSQAHTYFDLNMALTTGGFGSQTQTFFKLRDATHTYLSMDNASGVIFNSLVAYDFQNTASTAIIRNSAGVLSLRGGISTGTKMLQFTSSTTNSTDLNTTFNFTGTTHSISTAITRTWTDILLDAGVTSTNASAIVTNKSFENTQVINVNSGTLTQYAYHYHPTITAGTLTHYGVVVEPTTAFSGFATATPTSTLHTAGSFAIAYIAKSGNYTLTSLDCVVEVTSGTNTQTLPTAVGITGRKYIITNSGSGVVTVATTSSQTFVNVTATPTTLTLAQFTTATVVSNGANWLKI